MFAKPHSWRWSLPKRKPSISLVLRLPITNENGSVNLTYGDTTMKIDELIERLQSLKEKHGDIEVKALDYDGDVSEIDEVEFDQYENAICIALPRASYIWYCLHTRMDIKTFA